MTGPYMEGTGGDLPADVYQAGDRVVVTLEVPGVLREELMVFMEGGLLVVEGTKREPGRPGQTRFLRMERQFGNFHRAIELPGPVNPAKASAHLAEGVLRVVLPRLEDKRRVRIRIPVRPEGEGGER